MIASLGKTLVVVGLVLTGLGLALVLVGRLDILRVIWERLPLGRLPGDIHLRGKDFSVFFPWVTCLVISVVVSVILSFFRK
ncbi:MAG: DUF2905 domain-containing protein [Desulfovibrionaceae bacterium]|jgi:hypothetical protein